MARKKNPRAPSRPWCPICKGEGLVDGPPLVKKFENGPTKTYPQRVPCECTKPKAPPAPTPPPAVDQQSRAAGEDGA